MGILGIINSKSKQIKVYLIELARYDYRILEQNIGILDINEHILIEVAHLLNKDKDVHNKWLNAVRFGIYDKGNIGIIGDKFFKNDLQMSIKLSNIAFRLFIISSCLLI